MFWKWSRVELLRCKNVLLFILKKKNCFDNLLWLLKYEKQLDFSKNKSLGKKNFCQSFQFFCATKLLAKHITATTKKGFHFARFKVLKNISRCSYNLRFTLRVILVFQWLVTNRRKLGSLPKPIMLSFVQNWCCFLRNSETLYSINIESLIYEWLMKTGGGWNYSVVKTSRFLEKWRKFLICTFRVVLQFVLWLLGKEDKGLRTAHKSFIGNIFFSTKVLTSLILMILYRDMLHLWYKCILLFISFSIF